MLANLQPVFATCLVVSTWFGGGDGFLGNFHKQLAPCTYTVGNVCHVINSRAVQL